MGTRRTAWHFFFAILLRKQGPRGIEVRDEVALSEERPRLDYLLLRKTPAFEPEDAGATLRGLWPLLPRVSAVELKTISGPYAAGGLDRLWIYTHAVCAAEPALLERRSDLCAVLIVPCRTPTLDRDIERMGLAWCSVRAGYWRVTGGLFALYVVELDVVAEHEDDDLLRLFGHARERTPEARRFWAEQVGSEEAKMAVQELEGFDEVMKKFLDVLSPEQRMAGLSPEQRLAGLPPEQRLAGLPPEQRLAGLPPEQRLVDLPPDQAILALPDAVLRTLPADYVANLPEPTRSTVRARRGEK